MPTVNIRRRGGAAVMTIPAEVMKSLGRGVGAALEVSVVDARRAHGRARRRSASCTLDELPAGATQKAMRKLSEGTAWARDGDPIDREILCRMK